MAELDFRLQKYNPPPFAEKLRRKPQYRVKLLTAQPTPVVALKNVPSLPAPFTLSIKRDDLTGAVLSGNKCRKLEFILADAIANGATAMITCGAVQSNHARAACVAARELGLQPYAFLRSSTPDDAYSAGAAGNMALHKLIGTDVRLVPRMAYLTGLKPRMEALAEELSKRDGTKAHLVPVGGSDEVGVWGYLEAWFEMLGQGVAEDFDDLVLAAGSGGTAAGLAIGNYLTGMRLKIHAFAVCDSAEYFYYHIDEMILATLGPDSVSARDIIHILDGYKGLGYGKATGEELDHLQSLARATGLILDPVYTNKAFRGMIHELRENPSQFAGHRLLFLHTGGIFGALGHPGLSERLESQPTS